MGGRRIPALLPSAKCLGTYCRRLRVPQGLSVRVLATRNSLSYTGDRTPDLPAISATPITYRNAESKLCCIITFSHKSVSHSQNLHTIVFKISRHIVLTLCICEVGNRNFEHPALLIYIDKLVTDDIISIRFCQMCSHQATCPRISG